MNRYIIVIILHLSVFIHQTIAATLALIQACEAQTGYLYIYEQCVNCALNCSLCNGVVLNSVCVLPTAASCNIPGFLYNVNKECRDCRIEEDCLRVCDGYWQTVLKTCLRAKNRSYQVVDGISCLDANETNCPKCRDQKFLWSSVLQKCLRCPSFSTWDATKMTCSSLSNCTVSSGLGFDSTSTCSTCSTQSLKLSKYSLSCESCQTYCSCSGMYAQCDAGSCAANYSQIIDGDQTYCECKGANYHNGTTCLACPSNCIYCKSDGKCIQCATGYLIDKTAGTCVDCAIPSASDSLYCEIQAYAYCQTRTADGKYCNVCQSDLIYDSAQRYCACTGGRVYNPTTQVCFKCSDKYPYCGTCNNSVCYTCLDSSFKLAANQQSCSCTGFIKNNTCVACTASLANCASCNSTGTTCTSCLPAYGLLTSTGACYACNTINISCISCDGTNKCTACTNGYTLNAAKTSCDCDVSTTLRAVLSNVCYTCSMAIANCNKCTKNTAGTALQCTECMTPYVLTSGACQLCGIGYYRDKGACVSCSDTQCASCNSQTSCFACKNGYTLSGYSCICPSPKVLDFSNTNNGQSVCRTCAEVYSPYCTACDIIGCNVCSGNYNPQKRCQCTKGINIPEQNKCLLCSANCSTCTTVDNVNTTCTLCDDKYKLLANNTCVDCGTGKYYNSTTKSCNTCNDNCSACSDNQNGGGCTACNNNYQLNQTAGTCICTNTMVISATGPSCVLCSSRYLNCSTCDTNGCITCTVGYYLKLSTKTCIQCTSGQYFKADNVNDCVSCQDKCSACAPYTGFCTGICSSNYDLNSTTGLCQCKTTKYLNGDGSCSTCYTLITNCLECSSTTVCTKCSGSYRVMVNGSCAPCPSKTYYDPQTKTCLKCEERCNGCADETGLCTLSCTDNYRIENGICVCTKDRSLDVQNACKSCGQLFENCLECNSLACTKCNAPFFLTEQGKCRACYNSEIYLSATRECKLCKSFIKNCNSCSSTTICTKCLDSSPFQLSQNGDSCFCPTGFYLIPGENSKGTDDQCLSCTSFDPKCLQCQQVNVCSHCADKYFFDTAIGHCRLCNSHEYYDTKVNGQTCLDCNQVHEQCIECIDQKKCTSCKNNYEPKDQTCKCTGSKILISTKGDESKKECKWCKEVVDPNCDQCNDQKKCIKCFNAYRWDEKYNRCIPDITLKIYSENNDSSQALADKFNMIQLIPEQFSNSKLLIQIYFFDTPEQYNSEVQLLKSKGISDEDIPYNFQNCVNFISDDLSTLPNPNYISDSSTKILRRADQFLLHEGDLIFVRTVESQNNKFQKFTHNFNIKVNRNYNNMKDLSFNVGKIIKTLSPFSFYQVFNQILIQQNEICEKDEQCSNNGTCVQKDKLCKCIGNFKLFDCSDYVTITYDLVIDQLTSKLLVNDPVTYQEKFVSINLPLLVTQSSVFSLTGISSNFQAIQHIIKSASIDNNERDDIDNLMKNIMNNVSKSIKEVNTDFAPNQIISTIKQLQSITEQLLSPYNNKVSFYTDEMQLLASIEKDPSRINTTVDIKKVFDITYDSLNSLFTPSDQPSENKAKILRYSFKENPHKVIGQEFQTQPRIYPLIIANTYQQAKRILQQSEIDTFLFVKKNMTFIFDVQNPRSLKNLICLTLADTSSDKYILCEGISISDTTVSCNCQNSATLYEDIHYNYLQKPELVKNSQKKIPLSMIIAVVALSILLAICIFLQIKNKKKQLEREKIAKAEALYAAQQSPEAKFQILDSVQNRHLKQGSQEMTLNSQQNNKTEYDTGIIASPYLNVKNIRLNLFDTSQKQSSQHEDFVLQTNGEFDSRKQLQLTTQDQVQTKSKYNQNSKFVKHTNETQNNQINYV